MVNVENFAKRINILLKYYEISAASLAEKIEVQRSSISHILSGRNKPSLDFVMKILKAFPEVELYWLLNGVGDFPNNSTKKNIIATPTLDTVQQKSETKKASEMPLQTSIEKDVEKIVIFFKDGTFKIYTP